MKDIDCSHTDWNFIIDKIKKGQCLLVLGPELLRADNREGFSKMDLKEYLNVKLNSNVIRYYEDDDLYLFDQPYKRTLLCHQIQTFYNSIVPNKTFNRIAEIPFNVILSVTPDKIMNKSFDDLGCMYQFGYYKKNKDPQKIASPTSENPLIYNMFGCIDSEESMILTYNDLYDYFKSIFARRSMPDELKLYLKDVKNVVFLGVSFEKWYMQLLLRELEIHNQEYAFIRYAVNQTLSEEIMSFCVDQFQINFIPNNIDKFIIDLHSRCELEGIIRVPKDMLTISYPQKIRSLVSEDKLEEAISSLCEYAEDKDLKDESIGLSSRMRRFKMRENQGTVYEQDKDIQYNQIRAAILDLLKEVELRTC